MRLGLAFLLITAACGAPGRASDVDGSVISGNPGMAIVWNSEGTLPGMVSPSVTVSSATFNAHDVRLIGDASGSNRTNRDADTVAWTATGIPAPILFPDAPPGLYSKVSFELDGKLLGDSYEITGTVVVASQTYPFAIHDVDEIEVSQTISAELQPGGHTDVLVVLDLAPPLAGVDFSMVRNDGGTLVLDNASSQLGVFREQLRTAFTAPPPPPQ